MKKSDKLERIGKMFQSLELGKNTLITNIEEHGEDEVIRFGGEVVSDDFTFHYNILELIEETFEGSTTDVWGDAMGWMKDVHIPYTHKNLDDFLKLFSGQIQAAFEQDKEEYQEHLKSIAEAENNKI